MKLLDELEKISTENGTNDRVNHQIRQAILENQAKLEELIGTLVGSIESLGNKISKIEPAKVDLKPLVDSMDQMHSTMKDMDVKPEIKIPEIEVKIPDIKLVDEEGKPINWGKFIETILTLLRTVTLNRPKLGGHGGGEKVDNETPTGTVNGSNTVFTLANVPKAGTVKVYVNGSRMQTTGDYTISSATITFNTAPPTTSIILCDYEKA